MRGLALCASQLQVARPPAAVGGQIQSPHDESIDVLEHEDLGQQELVLGPGFEFLDRLVRDLQKILAGDLLLELLDTLEDELAVLLFERPLRMSAA